MRYNIAMLNRIESSQEQLCRECVLTQPDQNCWYRETLAEIAEEVSLSGTQTVKKVLAQFEQDPLEANRRMIIAYGEAVKMECPNITTTEFPNIPGL